MAAAVVLGLGHHACKVHWPTLERAGVRVALAVDIAAARPRISAFLSSPGRVQPDALLLLDEAPGSGSGSRTAHHGGEGCARGGDEYDVAETGTLYGPGGAVVRRTTLAAELDRVYRERAQEQAREREWDGRLAVGGGAGGAGASDCGMRVIVSSDGRAHLAHATAALSRGRTALLIDKPVSAPPSLATAEGAAAALVSDVDTIAAAAAATSSTVDVLVQRRYHEQYEWLCDDVLAPFVARWGVPLSSLAIEEADGRMTLPHEWTHATHSYATGHGKLLHSGYHMVDLARVICNAGGVRAPLRVAGVAATLGSDAVAAADDVDWRRLFGDDDGEALARAQAAVSAGGVVGLAALGELDVHAILEAVEGERLRATVTLALLHNSLSHRAAAATPADTYKGAGRVKRERVTARVGHLLAVDIERDDAFEAGVYRARVARNAALLGGPATQTETFRLRERGVGIDEHGAKKELIDDWLRRPGATKSTLASHAASVSVTAELYAAVERSTRRRRHSVATTEAAREEETAAAAAVAATATATGAAGSGPWTPTSMPKPASRAGAKGNAAAAAAGVPCQARRRASCTGDRLARRRASV
uniref:Gfo/Idh/MocA-like oxidoreductase N-terminal domain-containing protein n=1 Tax=Bicosoecida sp. CB-2014 TaxID=1486930 RepID=A0A7S1CB59_9STRA